MLKRTQLSTKSLGKTNSLSLGNPLKIIQNESVTKKRLAKEHIDLISISILDNDNVYFTTLEYFLEEEKYTPISSQLGV